MESPLFSLRWEKRVFAIFSCPTHVGYVSIPALKGRSFLLCGYKRLAQERKNSKVRKSYKTRLDVTYIYQQRVGNWLLLLCG